MDNLRLGEGTEASGGGGHGVLLRLSACSEWLVSKEAEWVTLSAIRVFRFILKHHLHCTGCSAVFPLKPAEFRTIDRHMRQHESIDGTDIHVSLAKRIEAEQLAGKTPLQLKFICESMAAQKQYKAAIKSQDDQSH
ncbi:hypothetical protein [Peristeroidobacter soli]|uniref:hypothetical protein n=1 Tax=Peristeroidobacter soli TaxID=2497877 RepID=UPI00101E1CBA|nr:hypothetical protein [Peristeroidobacter soli]